MGAAGSTFPFCHRSELRVWLIEMLRKIARESFEEKIRKVEQLLRLAKAFRKKRKALHSRGRDQWRLLLPAADVMFLFAESDLRVDYQFTIAHS